MNQTITRDMIAMKWVKLSAKMMKLKFMPCEPWYIEQYCHGSCCRSSVHKDGISVVIHKNDRANYVQGLKYVVDEYKGEPVLDGFLMAKSKRCPFQEKLGLCKIHPKKPFGCITSPFTLNHNDTLIVRNRYKLLKCFRDAKKQDVWSKVNDTLPKSAYENFYPSLQELFGMMTARRIYEHFDKNGDDMTMSMDDSTYQMLKDNDNARRL